METLSRTVKVGGEIHTREQLARPYWCSSLLGAVGDSEGSAFASRRAVSVLRKTEQRDLVAQTLMEKGEELQARSADPAYYGRTALQLLS